MQRVLADDRAQSKGPVANPCECNGQQSFRFSVNSMYQPTIVQPTGGQPGCCEQRTGLSPSSSGEFVYPIATDASQQLPGCYCPAPATFLVGAVGPDEVLPPDAGALRAFAFVCECQCCSWLANHLPCAVITLS